MTGLFVTLHLCPFLLSAESKWEELHPGGERPPALQEHSAVAYKDCLYVFGGELGFSAGTETPLWVYSVKVNAHVHYVPRTCTPPVRKGERGTGGYIDFLCARGACRAHGRSISARLRQSGHFTKTHTQTRYFSHLSITIAPRANSLNDPPPRAAAVGGYGGGRATGDTRGGKSRIPSKRNVA